jgi:hypothetical protein
MQRSATTLATGGETAGERAGSDVFGNSNGGGVLTRGALSTMLMMDATDNGGGDVRGESDVIDVEVVVLVPVDGFGCACTDLDGSRWWSAIGWRVPVDVK